MLGLGLRKQDVLMLSERKTLLLEKARIACEYLHALGAAEVYLFGSIPRDDVHLHSDVDIAVSGLPFKHVYSVESKIGDILGTDDFDFVYLEYARERVRNRVREQGVRIC
jgi:predicted nucleotidyltransferase